jgi:prepilin-type N-terminal cleavage/methylation domain-containing protein
MSIFQKRGFTLIELLVVIAIVGILAAIVMAALNDAREKGGDAAVKSNLANARSQAEVVYNTRTANLNTYTGVCTNGTIDGVQGIGFAVLSAAKAVGLLSPYYSIDASNALSDPTLAVCNAGTNAWAAQVPLKEGGFWCVDSTNKSFKTAVSLITSTTDRACS